MSSVDLEGSSNSEDVDSCNSGDNEQPRESLHNKRCLEDEECCSYEVWRAIGDAVERGLLAWNLEDPE